MRRDRLPSVWRRLLRDSRANVTILVAVAAIPIFGMLGLALDYAGALAAKTRLNTALDAASLGAISQTMSEIQSGVIADTAKSDGETQGGKVFNVNAGPYASTVGSLSIVVGKSGQVITATSSYNATAASSFGRLFGIPTLRISGANSASLQMPQFLDFYVMIDVSGSMGIPSTDGEQARLAKINPDDKSEYPGGCTLACHFTTYKACDGSQCQGFILSRQNGDVNTICTTPGTANCIQLRLDAIGVAVTQLLATAQATETATGLSNQFRIGIYPFIIQMNANYQPLSTDLTGAVTTQAHKIPSLLDPGNSNNVPSINKPWNQTDMGSGGTNLNNALNDMYETVPTTPGDGNSSTSTKPFVFLITDGAQDNQIMHNSAGAWYGSNQATVLTQSYCTQLKARATLAILYVPYTEISNPNASFAGNEDGYANANIPNISPSLQSCASSGFFYTANAPSDITNALQAMFANALNTASRLLN